MSACIRCGAPFGVDTDDCEPLEGQDTIAKLHCRDRELANLRSLFRSVTGDLEAASELLEPPYEPNCARAAQKLVQAVLETLS